MNFWFKHQDGSSACIEQIGRDMFMVTLCRKGKVVQTEMDMDDVLTYYHSLLDFGYVIAKKGE